MSVSFLMRDSKGVDPDGSRDRKEIRVVCGGGGGGVNNQNISIKKTIFNKRKTEKNLKCMMDTTSF